MPFDVLNDDCWLDIINKLKVRDQISLYEATNGISNRLNACVIQNWKLEKCFYIDEASTEKFLAMPEMLNIFLSSVSRNMVELKLDHVRVEFLKRFVDFTFPNMKTLDFKWCISYLEDQSAPDECLRLMTELFPGLHSLKAHSGLNFNLLQHFTQLRKLELTKCWLECQGPEGHNIEKCQLLEEVIVHYNWDSRRVKDCIRILPKLHTVFFHLTVTEWYNLLLRYDPNIERCFNNGYRQYGVISMMIMEEIQSWIDPYCDFNKERISEMLRALKQMLETGLLGLKEMSKTELREAEKLDQFKLHYLSDIYLEEDFFKVDRRPAMEEEPFTLYYHKDCENKLVMGVKAQISPVTIKIHNNQKPKKAEFLGTQHKCHF